MVQVNRVRVLPVLQPSHCWWMDARIHARIHSPETRGTSSAVSIRSAEGNHSAHAARVFDCRWFRIDPGVTGPLLRAALTCAV
jgi:hypothetical protein